MTVYEKFIIYPILSLACFVSGYFTHLAFDSTVQNQQQLYRLQKDVKQIQQMLMQLTKSDSNNRKIGGLDL